MLHTNVAKSLEPTLKSSKANSTWWVTAAHTHFLSGKCALIITFQHQSLAWETLDKGHAGYRTLNAPIKSESDMICGSVLRSFLVPIKHIPQYTQNDAVT